MKPTPRKRKRPSYLSDEDKKSKKMKNSPTGRSSMTLLKRKQRFQQATSKSSPVKHSPKSKSVLESPDKRLKAGKSSPVKKKATPPNRKVGVNTSKQKKSPLASTKKLKKTKTKSSPKSKSPAKSKTGKSRVISKVKTVSPKSKAKSKPKLIGSLSKSRSSSGNVFTEVAKRGRPRISRSMHLELDKITHKIEKEQATRNGDAESGVLKTVTELPKVPNDKSMEVDEPTADCKELGRKFVGAHVSIAKGIYNAVGNALDIGAKAFALFLRSQRQWVSKPMDEDDAEKFKEECKRHGFPPHLIIPHGSYLMNCGSPDKEILKKSRIALVEDLQRCEKLGLTMFNFHPGSSCGAISVEECLDNIADSINYAHERTESVITVVENMSCQGNTVGGNFEELRGIIDRVQDKSRIGVCFDTCHAYAAGHDISTEEGYEKVMAQFESVVGFKYMKAVHLNDSKGDLGCHQDRHENIGKGKIGITAFHCMMNDPRFDNIPLVLETPMVLSDAEEIKLLYSLGKKGKP
ncbi:probable endonuclease 4 isoform X2 [Ptychodera flava]|uniref:probable endonuclease 4 isoform X2 n=1 Tax=Ptychodera flava TaxID=63121 RepID=UPI00396A3FEA